MIADKRLLRAIANSFLDQNFHRPVGRELLQNLDLPQLYDEARALVLAIDCDEEVEFR